MEQLAPIHALLVDDDPMILALLGAFLNSKGYTVVQAADGEAALDILEDSPINLVITDWVMPGMDGLTLCQRIRELKSDSYRYLVMLTSNREADALVNAMQAGVDDFLMKPFSPVELGARLHAAERVLALQAGLANKNRKLADAYQQLSRELELARSMQLAMLPPRSAFQRIRFDWVFEASSYVGGDMFDYFQVDEQHLCFYLVDVSGHGVSAAMLASTAHNQLLSSRSQIALTINIHGGDLVPSAEAMVAELNTQFMQMKETSLYLTMVYGLINTETGDLALVQAGHPAALHVSAQGDTESIGDGGLPIGIVKEATFHAYAIKLQPGSRLYVYSDGITECTNASGDFFGLDRLEAGLLFQRGSSLERTSNEIRRQLLEWKGDAETFNDDVTLLSLEFC